MSSESYRPIFKLQSEHVILVDQHPAGFQSLLQLNSQYLSLDVGSLQQGHLEGSLFHFAELAPRHRSAAHLSKIVHLEHREPGIRVDFDQRLGKTRIKPDLEHMRLIEES